MVLAVMESASKRSAMKLRKDARRTNKHPIWLSDTRTIITMTKKAGEQGAKSHANQFNSKLVQWDMDKSLRPATFISHCNWVIDKKLKSIHQAKCYECIVATGAKDVTRIAADERNREISEINDANSNAEIVVTKEGNTPMAKGRKKDTAKIIKEPIQNGTGTLSPEENKTTIERMEHWRDRTLEISAELETLINEKQQKDVQLAEKIDALQKEIEQAASVLAEATAGLAAIQQSRG